MQVQGVTGLCLDHFDFTYFRLLAGEGYQAFIITTITIIILQLKQQQHYYYW